MKLRRWSKFSQDESGGIIVDWVVPSAAIVAVAMAMTGIVRTGY